MTTRTRGLCWSEESKGVRKLEGGEGKVTEVSQEETGLEAAVAHREMGEDGITATARVLADSRM